MTYNNKKILLVRTDKIGDVVLTLPCSGIIKKNYPNSEVHFLVSEYTKSLPEANFTTDKVLTIKSLKDIKLSELVKIIKGENYDICIVFHPRFKIALAALLAGIKLRIGTGYRWYSFLFNSKVYDHRKTAEFHELEYNIRLLQKISIKSEVNKSNIEYNLKINNKTEQKVIQELSNLGINLSKKNIIIHPGSGGSSEDWPIKRFSELVFIMAHKLDVNIFITGSLNEFDLCNSLTGFPNVYNLAGKFNLEEFMALVNLSEVLIANSTGPIHIAAALDKKVIGFYPKIVQCSAKRWGPYSHNVVVFEPTIGCKNCTREQCSTLNCMNSIESEDVFLSVDKFVR